MITNEVSLCIRDSHFLIVEKTAEQIFRAIEFSLTLLLALSLARTPALALALVDSTATCDTSGTVRGCT